MNRQSTLHEVLGERFTELLVDLSYQRIREIERLNPNCSANELLNKIGQLYFNKNEIIDDNYANIILVIIIDYYSNLPNTDISNYLTIRNEKVLIKEIIINIAEYIKDANLYKYLREKHNYTIKELSALINITATTIKKWETGQSHPKLSMAVKLTTIYHIPLSEFLYEKNKKSIIWRR